MKKNVLSVLVTVLSASAIMAQESKDSKVNEGSGYNHWSIDLMSGFTKPTAPFAPGYYTKTFGFVHADFGVRYMFNNKFGAKLDFGYDGYEGAEGSRKQFDGKYMRTNIQGVVNVGRVLNFEDWTSRLGLQFHMGPGYSWMTNDLYNGNDNMVNIMAGITGQIRLTDRVSLNADFTMVNNIRQTYTFEGTSTSPTLDRGFDGSIFDASVGLSIYLGKNQKHADWYVASVEENKMADDQAAAMRNKLNDLEAKLADTDGDGVADAYDEEKNSAPGAMVDSKGRSIDLNNNGIADSTDKALAAIKSNTSTSTTTTTTPVLTPGQAASLVDATKLINDGYIAAYFDLGVATPNSNSTDGLGFILTYLRNNPGTSVEIYGNADETGSTALNNRLSAQRAQNVKNILVQAGISASRLNIIGRGEDKSVNVNSTQARKLVRKVTFRVK